MSDPFAAVISQDDAVARLKAAAKAPVHAYLLLGPRGSGSYQAALGFAALLLTDESEGEAAARHERLALEEKHPDLIIIEAQGAALRVGEAEAIIRHGSISPVEGRRKVILVRGIDAIEEAAIGKLLKAIEEPPASAIFVLLADEVPPEIITIASRCVPIEFGPISLTVLETMLFAEGVSPKRAKAAAAASGGDVDRARLLATDEALATRAALWQSIPDKLDGTGSTVHEMTAQLREGMDGAQDALEAKHVIELEALEERVALTGERGSGRSDLVAKQKREIRRQRVDELRFGLATLARIYRDRLIVGPNLRAEHALRSIRNTADALIRNPNEPLLLQALLLDLGSE